MAGEVVPIVSRNWPRNRPHSAARLQVDIAHADDYQARRKAGYNERPTSVGIYLELIAWLEVG